MREIRKENERGITLVALVVTIVVLLILAGISLNLVLGENGIIKKAKDAKVQTEIAKEREQVEVAYDSVKTGKLIGDGDTAVTDQELQAQLDKEIGSGKTTVAKDGDTLKVTYTETNRTYEVDDKGKTDGWDAIIDSATKHPQQDIENPDIGIGTDGKPVNLNWWKYTLDKDTNEAYLGVTLESDDYASSEECGYIGTIENGEINGKIPQYIKSDNKVYTVKYLDCTFKGLTALEKSPEIPETVISMVGTFFGCSKLKKMPDLPENLERMGTTFAGCTVMTTNATIPQSVKNLCYGADGFLGVFYNCTNLSGTLTINGSWEKDIYKSMFGGAATADGAELIVNGTSEYLDEMIATKSDDSNIHR